MRTISFYFGCLARSIRNSFLRIKARIALNQFIKMKVPEDEFDPKLWEDSPGFLIGFAFGLDSKEHKLFTRELIRKRDIAHRREFDKQAKSA